MGAVRFRYAVGLRQSWRSWLALAILSGLAAGLALVAITDARRSWTALPRALAQAHAADAQVSGDATQLSVEGAAAYASDVAALPGVVAATRVAGVQLARVQPDGSIDPALLTGHALGFVHTIEKGTELNRGRIIDGRPARKDRPEEVVINQPAADASGWRVGDRITDVRLYPLSDLDENLEPDPAKGTPVPIEVVGVVRTIDDNVAGAGAIPRVFLSPAFEDRYPESYFYVIEQVTLEGGAAALPAFRGQVERVAAVHGAQVQITATSEGLTAVRDGLRPQVVAIWLLGLVMAAVVVLLSGQAIGRQVQAQQPDLPELRALGMTPRQRRLLGLAHGLTVAAGTALVAVLVAYGLSSFTPFGSARVDEWARGLRLDTSALAIGAVLLTVALAATSAVSAARVSHRAEVVPGAGAPAGGDHPARVVEALAGAGASPAFVVGMRMALQPGRGRTAAPVRSVMTSIAISVVLVVATIGFAADLNRLVTTPRLYGLTWDAAVGSMFGRIPAEATGEVAQMPDVGAVSGLALGSFEIDGTTVPSWGVDLIDGTVFPTVEQGRLPQSASEVVLGRRTMSRLGTAVGRQLDIATAVGARSMTVVGVATFPRLGLEHYRETSLGTGAATVASVMGPGDGAGPYNYVLVRFDAGVDRARAITQLRARVAELGCPEQECVLTDLRPAVLGSYARLRAIWLPALLALGVLLTLTLAHGLVTSVRARREELAILSALGLSRAQTKRVIVWEALTLAWVALVIGIPLGIAGANLAWLAFARSLGISPGIAVPGAALAVLVIAVLAAAGLIGLACSVEATHRSRRGALAAAPLLR